MPRDGSIRILRDGTLSAEGLDLDGWLAPRAGLWQPVPSTPELIILSRADGKGAQGQVTFTGRITAPGDLTDVLQMVHGSRWEGFFNVLSGATRKTLLLHEGDIVGALSTAPEDRLGDVLVKLGIINAAQRDEALAEAGTPRRLGATLVRREVMTPHDLYKASSTQVEEIFFSLLLLSDGSYWFQKRALGEPAQGQLRLPVGGLLFEGVQRIDEMRYFREKIPTSEVIFERVFPPPSVKLDQMEMALVELVDGERDLKDVARAARVTEHVATRSAFRLLQSGWIRPAAQAPLGRRGRAAQKAGVTQILVVINAVLERILEEARLVGREQALRQAPATFYAAATPFSLLFENVSLDEIGGLEVEVLLDNLRREDAEDRSAFIYDALNEFLGYVVFLVCEGLGEEREAAVRARLSTILEEIGMAEAAGMS